MSIEHPFAEYIRILGKGRKGSRALTEDEARHAMRMILNGEVEPVQLGAFLMLMRVKEESPAEVAGFVRAVRDILPLQERIAVDLDWSSYAGKRRHLPWFLLAVQLLARHGVKVFMHGAAGHTAGRLYTRDILPQLGLPVAHSVDEAAQQLEQGNFAYLDLEVLCPQLQAIMNLRPLLGLRSPVHTVARLLNPFGARHVMQGIFHRGYLGIHQQAGACLCQPHLTVIKGEGGEIERNPEMSLVAHEVHDGVAIEEEWPAMLQQRQIKPETLEIEHLLRVWSGDAEDVYGVAAATGTLAVALKLLGRVKSQEDAMAMAQAWWEMRLQA